MSYKKLLLEDRKLFVLKVYNEMADNAAANTSDRENRKTYFLRLVEGNEELLEVEKRYCRERFIYDGELEKATYKLGKPRECEKCKATRYSDKFCERCISLH